MVLLSLMAGVNEDVIYRGVSFHVQTEDMGPRMGKVVSTVFFGGMVVGKREGEGDVYAFHEETKRSLFSGAFDEKVSQITEKAF